MLYYRCENSLSERHLDDNGYLMVDKSPILKTGVLEYYGSELLPEGEKKVDGVEVDPDKIYKVYISENELRKCANSFKLKPIVDNHTWLGDEGEDAKGHQEGTIGENVYVEDGYLYAPLMFTGKNIVKKITEHKKEELSSSYYNRFEKSKNPAYDFVARDIKGNHLALVDRGRCGSSVRVLNSEKQGRADTMAEEIKVVNEAILKLDGKEIDLNQFFEEEKAEKENDKEVHKESVKAENKEPETKEDDEEIIDDVEDSDEEEAEEEPKKEEKPEEGKSENKCSNEEKVEEEEEEEVKVDSKAKTKSENYDSIYVKISNEFLAQEEKRSKAYNSASRIVGDFNPFGMSEKDMYVKALNHLAVDLSGDETVEELSALCKVCNKFKETRVDNSFSYNVNSAKEEIELNI